MPARGVVEDGEDGWLEKPMAYIVLSRKDPAVDSVPQVTLEMQFQDNSGPVMLVLPSNSPGLAVTPAESASAAVRPCTKLELVQVVDPRDARDGKKDRAVTLEVVARGDGAVPDVHDLLDGLDDPLRGYTLENEAIEVRPTTIVQEGSANNNSPFYGGPPTPPEGGYPEADETGMYRLPVERSWLITYTPGSGSTGASFTLPVLREGVQAELVSKYFSDLDLVPVSGASVSIGQPGGVLRWLLIGAALVAIAVALVWRVRKRPPAAVETDLDLPSRITPLSAVMTLRRIQRAGTLDQTRSGALAKDIAMIEGSYFGPPNGTQEDTDLAETLRRWVSAANA